MAYRRGRIGSRLGAKQEGGLNVLPQFNRVSRAASFLHAMAQSGCSFVLLRRVPMSGHLHFLCIVSCRSAPAAAALNLMRRA